MFALISNVSRCQRRQMLKTTFGSDGCGSGRGARRTPNNATHHTQRHTHTPMHASMHTTQANRHVQRMTARCTPNTTPPQEHANGITWLRVKHSNTQRAHTPSTTNASTHEIQLREQYKNVQR